MKTYIQCGFCDCNFDEDVMQKSVADPTLYACPDCREKQPTMTEDEMAPFNATVGECLDRAYKQGWNHALEMVEAHSLLPNEKLKALAK